MSRNHGRDLIHRWEGNPAITIDDLGFACADISTAGAVKFQNEYLLLLTIQSLEGTYSIYPARSSDGRHFQIGNEPVLAPTSTDNKVQYEQMGLLDARVTPLEKEYYVTYDVWGHHGFRLGLARTKNFKTFKRQGYISEPDTKGGCLFPGKIKGRYARLERPWEGGSIWISYSDDLRHWGGSEIVMSPRGGYWDCTRIGTATPPVRLPIGWLIIYYGVKGTSAGPLFRLGAAILNLRNPSKLVGRTDEPILSPREIYERVGDLPNLVYSCGLIVEKGGEVKLYYGASNSCIAMGFTTVDALVKACMNGGDRP
ncbi:MAG: glycoside hydrolase family 130 protein [Candidatus Marinimicrobia bacterium]|nr:glycoside hydrolase family 130 protein [Candidatus Neomarinimicrobiota bacterium]